jgi:hypothetical protein
MWVRGGILGQEGRTSGTRVGSRVLPTTILNFKCIKTTRFNSIFNYKSVRETTLVSATATLLAAPILAWGKRTL